MTKRISRREFIAGTVATSALAATTAHPQRLPDQETARRAAIGSNAEGGVMWLDGHAPPLFNGATWGMPWPRGKHRAKTRFTLREDAARAVPLQSWPLAYWPDGSLKWTAHALAANQTLGDGAFQVVTSRNEVRSPMTIEVNETAASIEIDTGVILCRIPRNGAHVIESVSRDGREILRAGRLVMLRQDRAPEHVDASIAQEAFESRIEKIALEQRGPLRAVVKIDGRHANASFECFN